MAAENAIPISTETSAPVAGGPVRTITARMNVGGVPTQVQMQVIALSDANGVILNPTPDVFTDQEILTELREIRKLIAMFLGVYQPPLVEDLPLYQSVPPAQ